MKKLIPILTVFLFAASLSNLNAQSNSITANANVLGAITVSNVTNLDFGTLPVGQSSTVALTNTPGKFTVTSDVASSTLSFTLPACTAYTYCLTKADGTSTGVTADELQLTFSATDAGWDDNENKGSNPTNTFDPKTGGTMTPADGNYAVFIAGTATASADQQVAAYDGTITLTVTYN